ncbi:MAG: MurR/RpiR family transcriptional regulator [Longibaculum muris]|nr:MurR/RpiR family transcriptional regulator [Longibaculum muris]MBS5368449.1 MurR/RpiR family transcriptional regulator [Coprobacillus cateniformis]MCR1888081.1 MurR/RpiR family transcriptional regulator [Longibaculum muris]MED9810608.1 MurR/RpiR family transcriptional regulator [Longibaculum muris]
MSIMTQLEFELEFSESEKEIARYILNHGDDVLSMSVKELAKNTYTSPATIVRLCKKIGLEGYNDFKIKYSAELQYDLHHSNRIDVNFPFEKKDTHPMICHKLASLSEEVIADTIKLIDFDQLEKIVDLLYQSHDIDIYGSGNSLLAAMSFQHKMMRIARNVNLKALHGEQVFLSYNSDEKRIAVIISYSGETHDLIQIAQILKEKKTPIIVLTSIGDNHLSHYADYILNIGSREKIFTKIAPFASQVSMEYLLNVIFSCIFQKDYDQNIQNKISYDKKNDSRHPLSSPVSD